MSEEMLVDGAEFGLSRRGAWIAVFSSHEVIHLKQNALGWQAWNVAGPATEPICFSPHLEDCARLAVRHHKVREAEFKARMAKRLSNEAA